MCLSEDGRVILLASELLQVAPLSRDSVVQLTHFQLAYSRNNIVPLEPTSPSYFSVSTIKILTWRSCELTNREPKWSHLMQQLKKKKFEELLRRND